MTFDVTNHLFAMARKRKPVETNEEKLFKLRMSVGELSRQEIEIQREKNKTMKAIKSLMKKIHQNSSNPYRLTVIEDNSAKDVIDLVFGDEPIGRYVDRDQPTASTRSNNNHEVTSAGDECNNDVDNDEDNNHNDENNGEKKGSNKPSGRFWNICRHLGSQRELSEEKLQAQLEEVTQLLLSQPSSTTASVPVDKQPSFDISSASASNAINTHVVQNEFVSDAEVVVIDDDPASTTAVSLNAMPRANHKSSQTLNNHAEISSNSNLSTLRYTSSDFSHMLVSIQDRLMELLKWIQSGEDSCHDLNLSNIRDQCYALQKNMTSVIAAIDKHMGATFEYIDNCKGEGGELLPTETSLPTLPTRPADSSVDKTSTEIDRVCDGCSSSTSLHEQNPVLGEVSPKNTLSIITPCLVYDGFTDILSLSDDPQFHLYSDDSLQQIATLYGLVGDERHRLITLLHAMWLKNNK